MTDHCVVTATTSFRIANEEIKERNFLLESGRRFHMLDFSKASWDEIKRKLRQVDWLPMENLAKTDDTAAHSLFVDNVLPIVGELVPPKKNGKKFGKRKVDKERRSLWKEISHHHLCVQGNFPPLYPAETGAGAEKEL